VGALLDVLHEEKENLPRDPHEMPAKARVERLPHRTPNGWLSSAIVRLRRHSMSARRRGEHKDAQVFGFAAHMLMDLKRYGRPGLYVGMFYDDEWKWIGYGSDHEWNKAGG
jgi:hypothetical protein